MIHGRLRSRTALVGILGFVSTVLLMPGPANAAPKNPGTAPRPSAPPTRVTLDPVTAAGKAIGKIARERYPETFSGLKIDRDGRRVVLYATETSVATQMINEGRAQLSGATGTVPVVVERSRYSRAAMEKASAAVWESARSWKASGTEIYSIVLRSDGSGLEVRSSDPARAQSLAASATGLRSAAVAAPDLTFVPGKKVHSTTRADDSPPYYGGAPIRWDWEFSGYNCTSAFGVRNSAGTEFLATAEHCFDVGDGVEDGGGDQVGTVTSRNVLHDIELIQTDTAAGVWLNDTTIDLFNGMDYSWDGEQVCHSGYTLNMRCSVLITNEALQWQDDSGDVRRGVEGRQCAGCSAVAHGDSGGPVWVLYTTGRLESRGINSAGHTELPDGSFEYMLWNETPPAVAALGVNLLIQP